VCFIFSNNSAEEGGAVVAVDAAASSSSESITGIAHELQSLESSMQVA
jgi:predicted outer membrane repeat protein